MQKVEKGQNVLTILIIRGANGSECKRFRGVAEGALKSDPTSANSNGV